MRLGLRLFVLCSLAVSADVAAQQYATSAGMLRLLRKHGAEEGYQKLGKSIARYAKAHGGGGYLSKTRTLLENPVEVLDFADELTHELRRAARRADFTAILGLSEGLLDVKPEASDEASLVQDLATVVRRIESATELCEKAFAGIDPKDQEALDRAAPKLVSDFVQHIYVHEKPGNKDVWRHAQAIQWGLLFRAARELTPFLTRDFLIALRKHVGEMPAIRENPPGVEGRLLYAKQTATGWVLIGGRGKNAYDLPCAFLFDLGGDDVYSARTTASSRTQRVNIVIDAKGDDLYEAKQDFAQGCGRFGVSMLVDHRGNDTYRARRVAQGASLAGVGILADYRGKDSYEGDAFLQGAGAFGIGLLFDREGDDRMAAHFGSQGFAWPLSTGILIDLAGKDERIGTGKYPSSYGTKGEFNGMCQGVSVGFRTLACGGFGVLIDGGGDDVSKAGEFGHGCGYFFGTGIVRDFGGNDRVDASRYGISAGAHFGVSAVIDDAGNDVWRNPSVAAIAGNWDLTVSCFVDRRGADRYEAGGLAIGCATITSFAAFFDLAGKDSYVCGSGQAFGRAGHAQDLTRRTQSIGLFVDLGGGKDVYPKPTGATPRNRKTQALTVEQPGKDKKPVVVGRGVFVDR